MFSKQDVDEISQQILNKLPAPVQQLKTEVEAVIRQVLQNKLAELNFVSREEFEVQQQMILKNRQMLVALETKIKAMEAKQNLNND